ncbi:MAG TPA: formate dehydrogenase subunit delta [Rhodocyclaceae bacterium]|nr:formate dehydrogenase subunit delta [Rhodocyclaceae bacterium]
MNIDKLVKMANDIGNNYEAWPDRDAACQEVTNHLRKFWDPRMRRELAAHLAASGTQSGLKPLVAEAVTRLSTEPR